MHSDELEDFKQALHNHNFKENDFTINAKDITDWDKGTIVPIKGTVTIKRISTQKSKNYNSEHGTHWTVDFENDLKQGVFN